MLGKILDPADIRFEVLAYLAEKDDPRFENALQMNDFDIALLAKELKIYETK